MHQTDNEHTKDYNDLYKFISQIFTSLFLPDLRQSIYILFVLTTFDLTVDIICDALLLVWLIHLLWSVIHSLFYQYSSCRRQFIRDHGVLSDASIHWWKWLFRWEINFFSSVGAVSMFYNGVNSLSLSSWLVSTWSSYISCTSSDKMSLKSSYSSWSFNRGK